MTSPNAQPRLSTATVSDSRSQDDDVSGPLLRELLTAGGCVVLGHRIVRDEPTEIDALVRDWLDGGESDALVLTGGTGLAPRDRTVETVSRYFTKPIVGFGEAFRRLSWEHVGPRAILSNATAGICGERVLYALPGSPKAVRLGVEQVLLPTLRHTIALAHGWTIHGTGGR